MNKALLFLDLDEVLVTRLVHDVGQETIVALQPSAAEQLLPFAGQILVLTHRSRAEALQILRAFPEFMNIIHDVVAAEDIIQGALVSGQIFPLLRKGIEKSLYIRMVMRKYGVHPNRIAILDDNLGNVTGILSNGGGLGLLAPKPYFMDDKVITYDLGIALAAFQAFSDGDWVREDPIELPYSRQYSFATLHQKQVDHAQYMNRLRSIAKTIRSVINFSCHRGSVRKTLGIRIK